MFKLSITAVFKLIFFLLIFNFTVLANNFLVDKNNKLFIETSNSGFKFHKNYMSQNKYNFSYIEDNLKTRSGNYYQRFELRNGDCFDQSTKTLTKYLIILKLLVLN